MKTNNHQADIVWFITSAIIGSAPFFYWIVNLPLGALYLAEILTIFIQLFLYSKHKRAVYFISLAVGLILFSYFQTELKSERYVRYCSQYAIDSMALNKKQDVNAGMKTMWDCKEKLNLIQYWCNADKYIGNNTSSDRFNCNYMDNFFTY